eukprot:751254-Hanusia_phi.AAC.5
MPRNSEDSVVKLSGRVPRIQTPLSPVEESQNNSAVEISLKQEKGWIEANGLPKLMKRLRSVSVQIQGTDHSLLVVSHTQIVQPLTAGCRIKCLARGTSEGENLQSMIMFSCPRPRPRPPGIIIELPFQVGGLRSPEMRVKDPVTFCTPS